MKLSLGLLALAWRFRSLFPLLKKQCKRWVVSPAMWRAFQLRSCMEGRLMSMIFSAALTMQWSDFLQVAVQARYHTVMPQRQHCISSWSGMQCYFRKGPQWYADPGVWCCSPVPQQHRRWSEGCADCALSGSPQRSPSSSPHLGRGCGLCTTWPEGAPQFCSLCHSCVVCMLVDVCWCCLYIFM